MRLTVKTHHEATDRQRQMIAEYIERDNRELINEFEEAHVFCRLTSAGDAFLQSIPQAKAV